MKKLNNKGTTLVELIIGVVLLAIASMMLLSSFTTTANIINKATMLKNASSMTSACIELQQEIVTDENDEDYDASLIVTNDKNIDVNLNEFNSKNTLTNLNFDYKVMKNNARTESGTLSVTGSYIVASETTSGLKYREYLSSEFNFID